MLVLLTAILYPLSNCDWRCRTRIIEAHFNNSVGCTSTDNRLTTGLLSTAALASTASALRVDDPVIQKWCQRMLCGQERPTSQSGQDLFLWHNYFAPLTMQGRKGFYVDSGTNDYRHLSNTFFFDRCLGWEGLCIEPLTKYHENIRKHRTCKLVPECISSTPNSTLLMQLESHGEQHGSLVVINTTRSGRQRVFGKKPVEIKCNPLHVMLAGAGRSAVDLWSLDVEGHEEQVLSSVMWDVTPVGVLLVEGYAKQTKQHENILSNAGSGLTLERQMAGDAVFADRRRVGALPAGKPRDLWLPPLEPMLANSINTIPATITPSQR